MNTYSLFSSIQSILPFPTVLEKNPWNIIYPSNINITDLSSTLSIHELEDMIFSLSKQLTFLIEREKKCFFTMEPQYIKKINHTYYYTCEDHLLSLDENQRFYISFPIQKKSPFLSPEIITQTTIPFSLYYTSCFYSLGKIVESYLNQNITGTKMYYFMKRTLHKDPRKRYLLYI